MLKIRVKNTINEYLAKNAVFVEKYAYLCISVFHAYIILYIG